MMTNHVVMNRAIACNTVTEAEALLAELVADASLHNPEQTNEELLAMCRGNLGYLSGYYDAATASRIQKLFKAKSPVMAEYEGSVAA